MATEVENRVVSMRFDNKQFEAGVKQSMDSLAKLDESLNFKDAQKGIRNLEKAANSIDLSGMERSATAIETKFSAMSIVAMTAISRITNAAIDAGTNLVKSLSIDQVTAGFNKFETMTKSMRTIMGNLPDKPIEEINAQMEKLQWFTDETSYRMEDMTANIGKFVAQKVPLEDAVTAMQGIANWAAMSGQGINEASRAMYNLSQAMGVGKVKLQDWMSIENANMGTAQFKETALEAAAAVGTLIKQDGKYYTKSKKTLVTVQNFRETLSEDWFDRDTLMRSLNAYGSFTDTVYEIWKKAEGKFTTGQIIDKIKENYGDQMDEFGWKAFKAAQEYRTFADAVDATKEAVSSGWKTSFDILFGNAEEVTEVWTAVGDALWQVFASGAEARNNLLKEWADPAGFNGRLELFESIGEAWENITAIMGVAKKAFQEVFPPLTAERLYSFTRQFGQFARSLKLSEEASYTLKVAIKALLLPVKVLWETLKLGATAALVLAKAVWTLADSFLGLFAKTGELERIFTNIFGSDRYMRFMEAWSGAAQVLGSVFDRVKNAVVGFFTGFKGQEGELTGFQKVLEKIRDILIIVAGWVLDRIIWGLEKIGEFNVDAFFDSITGGFNAIRDGIKGVYNHFTSFFSDWTTFSKLISGKTLPEKVAAITSRFLGLDTVLVNLKNSLNFSGIFGAIAGKSNVVIDKIDEMGQTFLNLTKNINPAKILVFSFGAALVTLVAGLASASQNLSLVFGTINGIFKDLKASIKVSQFTQIAGAITVMAAALGVLALLDVNKVKQATIAMVSVVASLAGMVTAMALIDKIFGGDDKDKLANRIKGLAVAMTAMAGAVLLLASGLAVLSAIPFIDALKGLGLLAGVMTAMTAATIVLSKHAKTLSSNSLMLIAFALAVKMIVGSLHDIATADVSGAMDNMWVMVTAIGTMALLARSINGVNFGSSLAVTTMLGNLMLLVSVLKKLGKVKFDDISGGLLGMIGAIGLLKLMSAAISGRDGTSLLKGAVAIAGVTVAIKLLVGIMHDLASMDWTEIFKSVGSLSVLIGMFSLLAFAANGVDGGNLKGLGNTFLTMAASILVLGAAINYIGGMDKDVVLKGLATVSALMILFTAITALGGMEKKTTAPIAAMAVTIGLLTSSIMLLTLLDFKEVMGATAALSIALVSFGVACKLIKEMDLKGVVAPVVLLGSVIFALYEAFKLLQDSDPTKLIAISGSISLLIGAITAMSVAVNKAKIEVGDAVTGFAIMAGVTVALGAFLGVLGLVFTPETRAAIASGGEVAKQLASLTPFIAALTAVGMLMAFGASKLSGVTPAAVTPPLLSALEIVGAIAAVIWGVGKLDDYFDGGVSNAVNKGVSVMTALSSGIGQIAGALVSGIGVGLTSGLPEMAENLAAFGESIMPFVDFLNAVNVTNISSVVGIAESISTLSNSAKGMSNGGDTAKNLVDFSSQLPTVGYYLNRFSDNLADGASEKIKMGVDAVKTFGELASELQPHNGALQQLTGDNSLRSFGEEISYLGAGISNFANYTAHISQEDINKGVALSDMLLAFAEKAPKLGGLKQWVTGEVDLTAFGTQMTDLASSFWTFAQSMRHISFDNGLTEKTQAMANCVAVLADSSPKWSLLGAIVTGEVALKDFGQQLADFAPNFATYAREIWWVPDDIADRSRIVGESISALVDSLPESTSLKSLFTGSAKDLGSFSDSLLEFSEAITVYYGVVKGIGESVGDNLVDGLLTVNVDMTMTGKRLMTAFINGVKDRAESVSNASKSIANESLLGSMKNALNITGQSSKKTYDIGKYAVMGLNEGLSDANAKVLVEEASGNLANTILKKMKEVLGIHSPSTVFRDEVGHWIVEGIVEGLKEDSTAEEIAKAKGEQMVAAFQAGLSRIDAETAVLDAELSLWAKFNNIDPEDEKNGGKAAYLAKQLDTLELQSVSVADAFAHQLALYQEQLKLTGRGSEEALKAEKELYASAESLFGMYEKIAEVKKQQLGTEYTEEDLKNARKSVASNQERLQALKETFRMMNPEITDEQTLANMAYEYASKEAKIPEMEAYLAKVKELEDNRQTWFYDQLRQVMTEDEVAKLAHEYGTIAPDMESIVTIVDKQTPKFEESGTKSGQAYGTGFKAGVQNALSGGAGGDSGSTFADMFGFDIIGSLTEDGEADGKDFGKTAAGWFDEGLNWIYKAVDNASGRAGKKLSGFGKDMAEEQNAGYTDAQGINSPSKVWYQFAVYLIEGLVTGIRENAYQASKATADLAKETNKPLTSPGIKNDFYSTGQTLGQQIVNGIVAAIKNSKGSINAALGGVMQATAATPDQVTMRGAEYIGESVDRAVAAGVDSNQHAVASAVVNTLDAMGTVAGALLSGSPVGNVVKTLNAVTKPLLTSGVDKILRGIDASVSINATSRAASATARPKMEKQQIETKTGGDTYNYTQIIQGRTEPTREELYRDSSSLLAQKKNSK